VADESKPPIIIGPTNSVLWKAEVPWSPSSPCIWDKRIFLTTFDNNELQTRCYNRGDGKRVWTAAVKADKLETYHSTESSPAASTPATDGKHLVSFFGSFGWSVTTLKGRNSGGVPCSSFEPGWIRHRILTSDLR
jgi:hypothetical protein